MLHSIIILYSVTDFSAITRANMYIRAICVVVQLKFDELPDFQKEKNTFLNAQEKVTQKNGETRDR